MSVNRPGFQEGLASNWEPASSSVGDAISGAEFVPFPSPLPPASGRVWAGPQPDSSSLELLIPSFVQQTVQQYLGLGFFVCFISLSLFIYKLHIWISRFGLFAG